MVGSRSVFHRAFKKKLRNHYSHFSDFFFGGVAYLPSDITVKLFNICVTPVFQQDGKFLKGKS